MKGGDILIKAPEDEPVPCSRPDVYDWGPHHASIARAPPEFDVNAPVRHYIIEQTGTEAIIIDRIQQVTAWVLLYGNFVPYTNALCITGFLN